MFLCAVVSNATVILESRWSVRTPPETCAVRWGSNQAAASLQGETLLRHSIPFAFAATCSLVVGCVGGPSLHQSNEQRQARYAPYEGPPINQFTWLGHFYSWEPLGRDQLVVFTTPNDAYYLKVWPNCDLNFAMNGRGDEDIGVTSTSGTVSAGLDSVIENSSAVGHVQCPISEIRRIDYARMMADHRAQAQAAKAAQSNSTSK